MTTENVDREKLWEFEDEYGHLIALDFNDSKAEDAPFILTQEMDGDFQEISLTRDEAVQVADAINEKLEGDM